MNKFIIIACIVIIIIFIFIYYFTQVESFSYNIGKCSKNCCSTQWPIPIDVTETSGLTLDDVKNYHTSTLTCNNGIKNTGCVCLTEESRNMLAKGGYVPLMPEKEGGLLDGDNSISAFKIVEDKTPRPVNVLGQTSELTGEKSDIIVGLDLNPDLYKYVDNATDITNRFNIPVNSNVITYDNEKINSDNIKKAIDNKQLSETDKLLNMPIGYDSKNIIVNR